MTEWIAEWWLVVTLSFWLGVFASTAVWALWFRHMDRELFELRERYDALWRTHPGDGGDGVEVRERVWEDGKRIEQAATEPRREDEMSDTEFEANVDSDGFREARDRILVLCREGKLGEARTMSMLVDLLRVVREVGGIEPATSTMEVIDDLDEYAHDAYEAAHAEWQEARRR